MAILVSIEKLEPWEFNKPQIILMTKNEADFVEVNFYKNLVSGSQTRLIHFYRRSENNGE